MTDSITRTPAALVSLAVIVLLGCSTTPPASTPRAADLVEPPPSAPAASAQAAPGASAQPAPAPAAPSPLPTPGSAEPVDAADTAGLEASWGIRVEAVRLSAAGSLVDIRYRVLDPEKAASILGREQPVHIEDEATGLRFAVPKAAKLGALRQTARKAEAGRVYFILFSNPARQIAPGTRVALVLGDQRWPHLVVE